MARGIVRGLSEVFEGWCLSEEGHGSVRESQRSFRGC